jgi:hypothetical protein
VPFRRNEARLISASCITTSGAIYQTLPVTPGMEAGVTDHVWSIEEIVGLATNLNVTVNGSRARPS